MYHKYQTEAIVLRSYERGEADRVFAIYTKSFGLIWARASAVRRESSRLRYGLQQYAMVEVSLVRGAGGWRIVGVRALANANADDTSAIGVLARMGKLVERLVGGEEANPYLFATLSDAHTALRREAREGHGAIELLGVARILYTLGYVSAEALGTALFSHTAFTPLELHEAEATRAQLLSSVNKALSETHL